MRRLLALLFCALLLCAPAGAETFAVNAGENALLVTDEAGKLQGVIQIYDIKL